MNADDSVNPAGVGSSVCDASIIRLTPAAAAHPSLCPLCFEADLSEPSTPGVLLAACRHRSCKACLAKWIKREEASGQTGPPACPFCRSGISDEDVCLILGRPFQPRKLAANHGPSNEDDGIDELTLHWINEHTVPCGGCGYLIEKASGCDLIECLCGYRFCYRCGAVGGSCGCNPGHGFLNGDSRVEEGPIRDSNGRVDLRSCINRREVRGEREYQRDEKEQEEDDRWCFSTKNAAVCTVNGRWLFSPRKSSGCIRMLTQQLGYEGNVHHRASSKQRTQQHDNIIDVSWLFLRRGSEVKALRQFLVRFDVRARRNKKKQRLADEIEAHDRLGALNSIWLFLPLHSGLHMLRDIDNALAKHMKRGEAQQDDPEDLTKINIFIKSGAWLFHNSTPIRSWGNLVRLMEHSSKAETKMFMVLMDELVGRRSKMTSEEHNKQCLKSILLVFPWQDDEV